MKTTALRKPFLFTALLACSALVPTVGAKPPVAQTGDNSKYAAIVLDASSGEVLFSRFADETRRPASITKVMTLYLTYEALEEGRVKLTDQLVVSPRAASQPPSKLGLAAGQTISLDDAMRATAVRSANDMAVAIAEHIAGNEAEFTARMTAKARELGMRNTRFTTANGLPDTRQHTTASDLAILSRAVMRDYPQYYRYLGLHDWYYNGRDYRNTNGLLATGRGYDGIKTGFTNASGYNLAASAVRNNKRIITVVMGGRSTASRNAHVAELTDTGFDLLQRKSRGEHFASNQAFFEAQGFGIPAQPVQYASEGEGRPYTAVEATHVSAPSTVPTPTEVTPPPSARRPERRNTASTPAAPSGRWSVQVGAFREETVARSWLDDVSRRFRSELSNARKDVQSANGWYRSRFTGMTEDKAKAACETLAARRVTCMVIQPS
ncbi:D-alanyl-D-alanine carboxypeptidase [uncultured Brevundimonas sp.]|uniref:D-alanyl-D-alanine carboxypeptidase n=1 Tax=uncultured Brevundimonas sp. TaxID=213418 RepID=UPI002610146A|nr:D-alanyl-D-alanine carboxypeptidase [uncultured Brevundimonas sp.]